MSDDLSLVEQYADPFADVEVGIVTGSLILQGGAEEVAATLSDELHAPIYTMEYDAQRFDKEFHDKVGDRVVRLGEDDTTSEDIFDGQAFETQGSPEPPGTLSDFEDVETSDISADLLVATDNEAAMICYKSGKPYVTYTHHPDKMLTDYFWEMFDKKESVREKLGFLKKRYRSVRDAKKAARKAEHHMCNSQRTKQKTIEAWGLDEDQLTVVNPPIEVDFYQQPSDEADPLDGRRYFLAVQRLEPYKNVHTLVEAAKRAQEHIIFVGVGTMEDYVRREAQYSKYVHAYGYVGDEKLRELYKGAEATLQGTIREDFGMVPPESMACGTPCIAPASGGFLETVGEGYEDDEPDTHRTKRGLLLGEEDYGPKGLAAAMQTFDRDDYDPEHMKEYATQYSVDRFVDEVAEVLDAVGE